MLESPAEAMKRLSFSLLCAHPHGHLLSTDGSPACINLSNGGTSTEMGALRKFCVLEKKSAEAADFDFRLSVLRTSCTTLGKSSALELSVCSGFLAFFFFFFHL